MVSVEKRVATEEGRGREYYLPVETHLIRSRYVQQTFKIQVMQPIRRRGETARFPVVYATDGNFTFDAFKGISYSIQTRAAPRFIVVGICYPDDSPFAGSVLRARDLTFARYPKFGPIRASVEGTPVPEEGTKELYGAEDFQQFVRHELAPFIDESYTTIPGERTYFGHSAGGGFGLFTLFTQADLFRNYIISSPGMVYHGESSAGIHYENYDFLFQEARRFLASRQSLNNTKLYMSVGAEEEFEPAVAHWQLTSSFYRMAALIKAAAIPGLQLTTEVFAGESHLTVWPMAFIHGVQTVFGPGAARR